MVNQKNIVVIGASGSIGKALIQLYSQEKTHQVFAFSRSVLAAINQDNIMCAEFHFEQEDTIRSAAALVAQQGGADILIIATGLLHQQEIQPEKSIKRIE